MRVTAMGTTKRGRRSVSVDGVFWAAIHPRAAADFGLEIDAEIDEDGLDAVLARSDLLDAEARAYRLLSARAYTARRLREKLSEFGGEAAEAAVRHMRELGLVDDEDYARRYAEQLRENKAFAPRRVREALIARGIAPALAREVADESDEEEDIGRAADYLLRKYPDCFGDERVLARAYAALQRLGYAGGEIQEAFRLAECREEEE